MAGLLILLLIFYFLHSLLASSAVKRWIVVRSGSERWSRLFYSIQSTVLVLLIARELLSIDADPLIVNPASIGTVGVLLMIAGALLTLIAVNRFGLAGFIGLAPEAVSELVRSGIHGVIRHPIYTGIIMACIGWALLSPTLPVLVTIAITFIYLPIGIHLEERKLIAQFKEEYLRYRNEVPALFPRLKIWKGKNAART